HDCSDTHSLLPFISLYLFPSVVAHCYLHSFPTRRSSDLVARTVEARLDSCESHKVINAELFAALRRLNFSCAQRLFCSLSRAIKDRKSTRLNSSHVSISYAVFCLKKKKR